MTILATPNCTNCSIFFANTSAPSKRSLQRTIRILSMRSTLLFYPNDLVTRLRTNPLILHCFKIFARRTVSRDDVVWRHNCLQPQTRCTHLVNQLLRKAMSKYNLLQKFNSVRYNCDISLCISSPQCLFVDEIDGHNARVWRCLGNWHGCTCIGVPRTLRHNSHG